MRLLYFAWVRQKIGLSEEAIAPGDDVKTVNDLIVWLAGRGGRYAEVFGDPGRLRAAVNQDHAGFDAVVATGDEIAFFPPVTGG